MRQKRYTLEVKEYFENAQEVSDFLIEIARLVHQGVWVGEGFEVKMFETNESQMDDDSGANDKPAWQEKDFSIADNE